MSIELKIIKWVPVKETVIAEHGVRYDVEFEGILYPVNFNGAEWYFEAVTSPFLGKKVGDKIGKSSEISKLIQSQSCFRHLMRED